VILGYRFEGANSKDYMYVKLVDAILANGKGSGLIDLNLKLKQQVLEAQSQYQDNKDYTVHKLYGEPKEGQKLEEVKDLLLQQIDSVKQGRFADWLLPAIIDNMKLDMMKQAETNQGRVFDVVFAFVKDIPLEKKRNEINELSKITKADIVKFANERYGNNYAVCYKRMGEPSLFKVEKPHITPVVLNKDSVSAFRHGIDSLPFSKLEPKFADFANDIKHSKLAKGVAVDYIHNDVNKTFAMNYIFDMGTDNDKKLGLAFDYLPYLGTDKYNAAQLKQEFYKLGLSFGVNSSRDQVYVTLSGLEENLDAGIKLFEYMLGNVKADQKVYDVMVQDIIKKRADAKLNKDNILFNALTNYGKYGAKNPFNDALSNEEMKQVKADDLVALIKSLREYKHKVFYYGANDLSAVTASLDKLHEVPATQKEYPAATKYPELTTETQVYYATYPMKQAEMIMFSWDETYNKDLVPSLSMFNEYYGGNMSSVLFQEIREKQALAYSVYGQYGMPAKKDEKFSVLAYVGTQADKMNTAVTEVSKLLNDLPESQKNFDLSRDAVMKGIETGWITRSDIYWAYQRAQKRGLDYDIRKDIYNQAKTMKLADVHKFFDQHVKGKKYVYLVLGGKGDLDMKSLNKLGPVKELTLEQLFGY
jgi:predicted Zn-dependent peptidase